MKKVKSFFNKLLGGATRSLIVLCTYLFFRPKFYFIDKNKQHRKLNSPAVIISNHYYMADGPLICTMFRRDKIHSLAANEMYERKKLGWLLKQCRCIPIERFALDTVWLKKSAAVINGGESVCIFPEGKVTHSEEIQHFKSGFLMIAKLTGAPILPVYIEGPYKYIFGKRQRVIVGEPMSLQLGNNGSVTAEDMEAEAERYRKYMLYLQNELHLRMKPARERESIRAKRAAERKATPAIAAEAQPKIGSALWVQDKDNRAESASNVGASDINDDQNEGGFNYV